MPQPFPSSRAERFSSIWRSCDAERGHPAHRLLAGRGSGAPELRHSKPTPKTNHKAKDQNS
jgi:hypothetical protein